MNLLLEAVQWLFSPQRLEGINPIPLRLGEHLFYTFASVAIASNRLRARCGHDRVANLVES